MDTNKWLKNEYTQLIFTKIPKDKIYIIGK